MRAPAASWIELLGTAGRSTAVNLIRRPRLVTAPISVRLVVSMLERMASCLLRRLATVGVSSSAISTRMARPVVDRYTRNGVSAISSTGAAFLLDDEDAVA